MTSRAESALLKKMKRRSLWGIVPAVYVLISCLFFGLYLDSVEAFPQLRDPQAAEQRRLAREARRAEKEAARLAKEEARKAEEAARRQNEERLNPVSLEAAARYDAVVDAALQAAYSRFTADPTADSDTVNRKLPAMNAYRLQKGLTDFPAAQIESARNTYRGQITFAAAVSGAGDVVTAERNRRNELAAAAAGVRAALTEKNPAVFENSRLVADLVSAGIPGFSKEAVEPLLTGFQSPGEWTARQAAGFIDICHRLQLNLPELTDAADRLISLVVKNGNIYSVGESDSLYCGQVLVTAGESFQNKRWSDVGKTVVATYWEANPQTPFEEFYDLFNPAYFPRYKTVSAGSLRLITYGAPENVRLESVNGTLTVSFDEPIGQTFFFVIRGLPSLSHYQMYGLNWNRDPSFQNYYSGAYFNAAGNTFFVKIQIKTRNETIYLQP